MRFSLIIVALLAISEASRLHATVTEYEDDKPTWLAAAGDISSITFTDYTQNTIITTQYSHLGVTFTDGNDLIWTGFNIFPNDGVGLFGAFDIISISFDQPLTAIAVDHPGILQLRLYSHGQLIFTSQQFGWFCPGTGCFAGLISTQPFDAIAIYGPFSAVNIDDLHFTAIPAPSVLSLLGVAGLAARRRRRI